MTGMPARPSLKPPILFTSEPGHDFNTYLSGFMTLIFVHTNFHS
jgi:hypothetical protein